MKTKSPSVREIKVSMEELEKASLEEPWKHCP